MSETTKFADSKILVIDDSHICVEVILAHLRNNGFRAKGINDSLEAESAIISYEPDLILMDISMPGIGGIELSKILKERNETRDIPIIFITGEYDPNIIIQCFEYGNDYAVKPVREHELLTRINVALKSSFLKKENRLYELKLKEKNTFLNEIIDAIPAQIFVIDEEDRFLLVNDTFCSEVKLTVSELLDNSVSEIADQFQNSLIRQLCSYDEENDNKEETFEIIYEDNKDEKWMMCIRDSFNFMDRRFTLGVNLDTTQLKLAEEEKHKLTEQLAKVSKMEALGTMAGGIAHDFNNLLLIITGFTELVAADPETTEKQLDSLNEVLAAGRNAKDLIKQLLNFNAVNNKSDEVKIPEVIEESVKLSTPLTSQVTHKCSILNEDVKISGSKTQLSQLFLNLYTNARQATGNKGLIVTKVQKSHDRNCVNCGIELYNDTVYIVVSDNGHGIPPEKVGKIFEPYFTTKGIGEGTGLGLTVVHGIVSQHKGHICVESELNKGTTFHIYLPAGEKE